MTKLTALKAAAILGLLALAASAAAQPRAAERRATPLERDFRLFLEWFPGVYDNIEQVYFEGELDAPEEERHGRVRSHFFRVDLPELGEHIFYVQQDQDDDPTNIYRQRFYRFSMDEKENAVRLEIFSPPDPASLVGAHLDPSKLEGFDVDSLTKMSEGCDVFWRRQENQYIGSMKPEACRVQSRRSGKTLIISDDLVLTDGAIWIRDRAVDEDGNYVFGNRAGIHHKLNKVRPFDCWFAVRRKAEDGGMYFQSGFRVDDGGRMHWFETDEDLPQKYALRMRHVHWPTGTSRNSLVLYVHEEGSEQAVSYAWGDPSATWLGINLRFLQASCTLADSWAPE